MTMDAPRSYLFVPGDRPERFDKALGSAADAVVVDLEDAVAPPAKAATRDAVGALLVSGRDADRIVVRINDEATSWFDADLVGTAARWRISGLVLKTVVEKNGEQVEGPYKPNHYRY